MQKILYMEILNFKQLLILIIFQANWNVWLFINYNHLKLSDYYIFVSVYVLLRIKLSELRIKSLLQDFYKLFLQWIKNIENSLS